MFVSIYVYTRTALFPSLAFPLSLYISTCTDMHMYIYIYIEKEREREREGYMLAIYAYIYIYIYMYINMYVYMCVYVSGQMCIYINIYAYVATAMRNNYAKDNLSCFCVRVCSMFAGTSVCLRFEWLGDTQS